MSGREYRNRYAKQLRFYIRRTQGGIYGKYDQATINAVELFHQGVIDTPVRAWDMATSELFGEGSWGQKRAVQRMPFRIM